MVFPSWMVKFAAAAVIPVIIGVSAAMSAPVPLAPASLELQQLFANDDMYRPGEMGVDVAAVTGPTTSAVSQTRGCDDPSWPIVPFSCRDTSKTVDTLSD